jgi:thiosulfate reductase cytochrome b subunit
MGAGLAASRQPGFSLPPSSGHPLLPQGKNGARGDSRARPSHEGIAPNLQSAEADVTAIDIREAPAPEAKRLIHPRIVRITHWINAVTIVIMIGSGLNIHNAYPILPFQFPGWLTIGEGLAGALLWHFAFMWVLVTNLLIMMSFGLASGRYRRKLLPIRPGEVIADIKAALSGDLGHADLSIYNAVQKLLYVGVIGAMLLVIVSGVAIWKPVQFQGLTALFGGFQGARLVHFLAMAAIAGFLLVHVAMALIVPASLRAMLRGE